VAITSTHSAASTGSESSDRAAARSAARVLSHNVITMAAGWRRTNQRNGSVSKQRRRKEMNDGRALNHWCSKSPLRESVPVLLSCFSWLHTFAVVVVVAVAIATRNSPATPHHPPALILSPQ